MKYVIFNIKPYYNRDLPKNHDFYTKFSLKIAFHFNT